MEDPLLGGVGISGNITTTHSTRAPLTFAAGTLPLLDHPAG